jgi:phosphinothricin acetyltransferase
MAQHSGAYALIVAEDGGEVVGFASVSPYRPRPAYSTTVEDSVYVASAHRGHGVGKALLAELVDRARMHGFHSVIARIVGDHDASIALHRSCGFALVGTEREVGRKFGRWLDVDLMQLLL